MKSSQCTPDKAKRRPDVKKPSPAKGKSYTASKKPMRMNRPRG